MAGQRVIIWETLPILGGGQRVSARVAELLRRHDYEILFILPGDGPLLATLHTLKIDAAILPIGDYSKGVKHPRDILRFLMDTVRVMAAMASTIKSFRPDLLYVGGMRAFVWASLLGTIKRVPVVWHIHHLNEDRKTLALLRLFGKLRAVRLVVCVSQCVAAQYTTLQNKISLLYNGVETPQAGLDPISVGKRAIFSLDDTTRLIINIAALRRQKRQDILLRAAPHILQEEPSTRFVFVGGTEDKETAYPGELMEIVRLLRLEDKVHFTGECSDVPALLNGADLLVICSKEACPLVLFEACSAGVPVIGPDIGGTAELIAAGECGVMHRFGDPLSLASVCVSTLRDNAARSSMGARGRLFAAKFSLDRFADELLALLNSALPERI